MPDHLERLCRIALQTDEIRLYKVSHILTAAISWVLLAKTEGYPALREIEKPCGDKTKEMALPAWTG